MKINIKKLCLILVFILSPAFCFGADTLNLNLERDYLVTTEKAIKSNNVENPQILSASPFFTIFNEKNMLMVHPKKVGKTNFTIFLDNTEVVFSISVKPKNTQLTFCSCQKNGVEFTLLDLPPDKLPIFENFEIDAPPTKIEGKH